MSSPKVVADLRPAEYNPRKITPEALKMLARSLAEFGDLSGVVFNRKTGNLIGGHQRIKALDPKWQIIITTHSEPNFDGDKEGGRSLANGYIATPFGQLVYREVAWSDHKEKAANIAANKHGGDWDMPKLKELLVELNDGAMDISITGFDEKELQALIDFGADVTMPDLDASEKSSFRQMTFVVSADQHEIIQAAIDTALAAGPFEGTGNENKNGNALHRICATYKGGVL